MSYLTILLGEAGLLEELPKEDTPETRKITDEEREHWHREFRKGDHDASRILFGLYQSLNFPTLPLEQSLAESESKRILDHAANWIAMRRPEPEPGRVFSAEAVATLRRTYGASAIPE